jgi:PIN domain nuclease of toxin-antitoxin system
VRVLIDTQCWLWLCAEPERFSSATLDRLADPDCERIVSSASIWEIVIKHALGKLSLPVAPRDFVPSRLEMTQTEVLPISAAHALRVADLPSHHRDPFDRMIVAQALTEAAPLLTADKTLRRYGAELLPV